MPGAVGALMQLLLQREAAFRVQPNPAAAFKMPFTTYDVGRDPRRPRDPSVSASPLPAKSGAGDAVVQGSITSILDLRSIGQWLSLLLGVPVPNKAATKQPTLVTGVTVLYAESTTTAGVGTLSYTAAGTTLTWKAQGDALAGAPVNVGAGGKFTLESGTIDHSIVVIVSAPALPLANQADADINVSATLKAHVFPFNLDQRPSALLELGHTDTAKYYRTLGAKLNTLSFDVVALEQDIRMEVIAGEESEQAVSFDAAPTSFASVRSAGAGGAISNGVDTSLGVVVGGTLQCSNGMEGVSVADGKEGHGLVNQGEITLSGTIRTVFDSLGAFKSARDVASTRMRIGSQAAVGADIFQLFWDMPNVEFQERSVPKQGKSGLFVDLEWLAHRDTAGNLPDIVLVNDVAAY